MLEDEFYQHFKPVVATIDKALKEAEVKSKLYVCVEVYQLIVTDVHVFWNEKQAEAWYKEYTGVPWSDDPEVREQTVNDDYDQTKIFVVEV